MATTPEDPPLLVRLNDGREIPAHACDCGHCGNEFFVPGYSEEWMPSYCPYCGIKFIGRRRDGEDIEYRPKPEDPQE